MQIYVPKIEHLWLQHPLAQFDAQDLEYFENFTGIALNTTKEVEPDLPMCSFREFQVINKLQNFCPTDSPQKYIEGEENQRIYSNPLISTRIQFEERGSEDVDFVSNNY